MEVVVTDQGSGLKGVFEQKLEGMSVFQQETSTEASAENGPSGTMPPLRSSTG